MPQEFSGLPLCDIDPYYEDKKTFMVITGSVGSVNYIYRFSMHNVLVFLSPFHPIHRVAIHMHTSKAFNAILIINTTILANSFHRGVCEDGGDDDGSEGVGGEHIDGQVMDQIYLRAEPQQIVLLPQQYFFQQTIFRFSAHNALGFLSPFHPVRRLAINVLTSNAFTVVIITTIMANSFVMTREESAFYSATETVFTAIYTWVNQTD